MRIFIAIVGIFLCLRAMAVLDSFAEMTAAFAVIPIFLLYGLKEHLSNTGGESSD
jgi:hypothetical protein